MTEKIQQFIDEIRQKTLAMHRQLNEERSKNESLMLELSDLKSKLSEKEKQEAVLIEDIEKLKVELEASRTQVQGSDLISSRRRDEEIDELVKEIEYCISQLKK